MIQCIEYFRNRKNELDGEIFELLLTFSDFLTFKEMILDYKAVSFFFFNFCYEIYELVIEFYTVINDELNFFQLTKNKSFLEIFFFFLTCFY